MLSHKALALVRLHIKRRGDLIVDDTNRKPNRELDRAGLMVLGNSFRYGPGSIYSVSKLGFERKAELLAATAPAPDSAAGSRSRGECCLSPRDLVYQAA